MSTHYRLLQRTVCCLLLLLIIASCSSKRQLTTYQVPTISVDALYALVPQVEVETPDLHLLPTAEASRMQHKEEEINAIFADSLLSIAYRYLGTPYGYGSLGPRTFDCSGFVRYVYSRFGYDLPHASTAMAQIGRPIASGVGHYGHLRKGDIVLFSGRRGGSSVGHVGIFIEADPDGHDGTFIHAAVHGGVILSRFSEEYYTARYKGARRVI